MTSESHVSSQRLAEDVLERISRQVTDVVLCPGSRNTPLVLAALARRDLKVHSRIDERSAAFLALGIARVTGRMVPVITTSGTAVSHCMPAVIEAAHAHIPFMVLSADRPRRLVGRGASQTIDQVGLFGALAPTVHIDVTTDLTGPDSVDLFRYQQVHVNMSLDMPLLAELPQQCGSPRLYPSVPALDPRPYLVDYGQVAIDISQDTLVIAGDEAWEIPELACLPTIAEPTAPCPDIPVHPLAATTLRAVKKPQQVIVVGHPTLHRDVLALMADPDIRVVVFSRTSTVTDPAGAAQAVGTTVKVTGEVSARWLNICEAASQLAVQTVRGVIAEEAPQLTGLHVAAAVADSLADGDTLLVGSSNPVRDLSLVGLPFEGVRTFSPRGVAGIDGLVAQSVGTALATQAEQPDAPRAPRTVSLLGDISFLHDVGGLHIGESEPRPENLTIVVANDRGGGIFESLEIGDPEYRRDFERACGTPHSVDIAALCQAYKVDYRRAETLTELNDVLAEEIATPRGLTLIEAVTTRSTRREMHQHMARTMSRPEKWEHDGG